MGRSEICCARCEKSAASTAEANIGMTLFNSLKAVVGSWKLLRIQIHFSVSKLNPTNCVFWCSSSRSLAHQNNTSGGFTPEAWGVDKKRPRVYPPHRRIGLFKYARAWKSRVWIQPRNVCSPRCAETLKWSPGGHCARLAPSLGSTDIIGCISGIVARPDGTRSWAAERSREQTEPLHGSGPTNEGSKGRASTSK